MTMRHWPALTALALLITVLPLLLTLAGGRGVLKAHADHIDGFMNDWYPPPDGPPGAQTGLQQGMIAGFSTRPTLCTTEFPSSTWSAAVVWWNGLGGGSNSPYNYVGCPAQITVTTTDGAYWCGSYHACVTVPYVTDSETLIGLPGQIRVNPNVGFTDGSTHLTRDLAHEMGHGLGHDHYSSSGCPTASVMTENCYDNLQSTDVTNWHAAYHIDSYTNLSGSSTGPGQVTLYWNPSQLHNEADFSVWRWTGTGWSFVKWAGKDAWDTSFSGQPSGGWYFGVFPAGHADYYHFYGDATWTYVTVQ